jgi:hypothetical protein
MRNRGNILVENIVFIILNLVFIGILILFIMKQGSGAVVLEQSYAKQIALLLDSAKPGMKISLNMKDAIELAEKNNVLDKMVSIDKNIITVSLSDKGGYSYSFFNDVEVTSYRDQNNPEMYIFIAN